VDTGVQELLGAGIFGGVVGALVTQIIISVRAGNERRRERKGLLRLLYTEVAQNKGIIKGVADYLQRPDTASTTLIMRGQYVRAEAWKAVRVILAQRISGKDFAVLSDYYKNILQLEEVVSIERERKDKNSEHLTSSVIISQAKALLETLQQLEDKVQALIRAQVPKVTSEDKLTEVAQKQELLIPSNPPEPR
jgi:hypothetical protein